MLPLSGSVGTAIRASTIVAFHYDDPGEAGNHRVDALPYPQRDIFRGWIVESRNFVEIAMLELVFDLRNRLIKFGKIDHPTGRRVDSSVDMDFYVKRMPMQARTHVLWRQFWQATRGIDREFQE